MPLRTTVIGSYPKPEYMKVPNWFESMVDYNVDRYTEYQQHHQAKATGDIQKARKEVIEEQIQLGIDVITDGEISRENYIHHFCRKVDGISFQKVVTKSIRNNACSMGIPTIMGQVSLRAGETSSAEEWREAQQVAGDHPVKFTLPGPMTIINSCHFSGDYYKDVQALGRDLAKIINGEVLKLAEAGCGHIQVDEPLLVRDVKSALDYGINQLALCFEGISGSVNKSVHLCCGYPVHLDQTDYLKADPGAYLEIASKLDEAGLDSVSIEDAHRHNHLSLFTLFKKTTVVLGVVSIAQSKVESVEEIQDRLRDVLKYIPAERLVLSPDCGLGFLPRHILTQKLTNMVKAAHSLP